MGKREKKSKILSIQFYKTSSFFYSGSLSFIFYSDSLSLKKKSAHTHTHNSYMESSTFSFHFAMLRRTQNQTCDQPLKHNNDRCTTLLHEASNKH